MPAANSGFQPTGETTTIEVPIVGQYKQDIVRTPDGMHWVYGKGSQDALAIRHEMDPVGNSIHDYICGHFRPGLVFLDIGAHVGHYAIRAAKAGCTVYAVEANPECAAQLRMNMLVNKVTDVTLWCVGAWDEFQMLSFNADPGYKDMRGGGNSLMPMPGRDDMLMRVCGMPLDVLLDEVERVDLVKMDVEGADLRVLDGMARSIHRMRPKLIIEDHSIYGYFEPAELDHRLGLLPYTWESAKDMGIEGQNNFRIGTPRD